MRNFIPLPHRTHSNAGIVNMPNIQTLNGPHCEGGHEPQHRFIETGNVLCNHCGLAQDGWRIDPAYLDDAEFAHRFFDQGGVRGNVNCYPGRPGGSCHDTCAIHVDLISQSLGQISASAFTKLWQNYSPFHHSLVLQSTPYNRRSEAIFSKTYGKCMSSHTPEILPLNSAPVMAP